MATIAVQVGLAVAGTVLNALFAPKAKPQEGPRLNDMNLPSVSPGNPINRVFGSPSVGPQLIWTTGLKETKHETKVKGGKGGGAKSQTQITYTYSADVACAVCEGPVNRIRRIWANNKLLYTGIIIATGPDAEKALAAAQSARALATEVTARASDVTEQDEGRFGNREKIRIRAFFAGIDAKYLDIIKPGMVVAGYATLALTDAVKAWRTYLDRIGLASTAKTDYDTSEFTSASSALVDYLTDLATDLDLAVTGSSNAAIDGKLIENAGKYDRALYGPGLTDVQWGALVLKMMRSSSSYKEEKNSSSASDAPAYARLNTYTGSRTQMPDDIIEAALGIGEVPAYRGTCYFVIDELQLADYGNTLPTFKVEVEQGDANGKTSLKQIIIGLADKSGLSDTEYDVSKLTDIPMDGIAITQTSSARDVLQIVQNVCPFDVIESDFTMKFIDRYNKIVARLRPEDFSGVEYGNDDGPPPITTVRTQDDELPREINFTYQDPTRQYSIGTARAKRATTDANLVESVELPMVLTPTDAKTAVDRLLAYRYSLRRQYTATVPIKYALLDPGDAVLIPNRKTGIEKRVRLVGMDIGANGLIEMSFVDHVPPIGNITGLAYTQVFVNPTISPAGDTLAHILDLPALTETEDDTTAGFYVAFSRSEMGWPGGSLFTDEGSGGVTPTPGGDIADSGQTTWAGVASSQFEAGYALTTIPLIKASPYLWDRTSRLVVASLAPGMTMEATTEADILRSSKNTVVINGEIMQFVNVIDIGDGLFELSTLLRGRRGTEPFIAAHPAQSEAVFISEMNTVRYVMGNDGIGITRDYKAATQGQDIGSVEEFQFTGEGNWLKPYAPCHVRGVQSDVGGDITLSWLPRVRQGGTWKDGGDVVLDQAVEKYEVDVFDGPTFKRTLTPVDGARDVVYTTAMQTEDFGGVPEPGDITVAVYQIGAVVGRGFTNPATL
jgi:hypothetical protein